MRRKRKQVPGAGKRNKGSSFLERARPFWFALAAAVLSFSLLSWFLLVPRAIVLTLPASLDVQASGSTRPPALKGKLDVPYPLAARREGVQGGVTFRLLVNAAGTVEEAELIGEAHPLLERSARHALEHAVFAPAVKDGRSVAAVVTLPIRFQLE